MGVAAALDTAPPNVEARCREAFGDVAACPSLLPAVDGGYRAGSFEARDYDVFDVSFSAPYPKFTRRNAPPRFAHVVIKVGDLADALPFDVPRDVTDLPDDVPTAAVNVGRVSWGRIEGTLIVAPGYPEGGMDGGHVLLLWQDGEDDVAVSLHAWRPMRDAAATLAAIVASIRR